MHNLSTQSFRVSVANTVQAAAPLTLSLNPISRALYKLVIFATSTPDLSKMGFRVRNQGVMIVPDSGSAEAGITFLSQEAGWAALAAQPLEVFFGGRVLDGPPYNVQLDFYNTGAAAVLVGGFLHACEPEHSINELYAEIQKFMKRTAPKIDYADVREGPASERGPYPTMTKGG